MLTDTTNSTNVIVIYKNKILKIQKKKIKTNTVSKQLEWSREAF